MIVHRVSMSFCDSFAGQSRSRNSAVDALAFASALATDRKAFREADAPSPKTIELCKQSCVESDLVAESTGLSEKLKT